MAINRAAAGVTTTTERPSGQSWSSITRPSRASACRISTAGSKISLASEPPLHDGTHPVVKGVQLSGQNGILFRRNSLTGAIEAVRRAGVGVTLNEALHA